MTPRFGTFRSFRVEGRHRRVGRSLVVWEGNVRLPLSSPGIRHTSPWIARRLCLKSVLLSFRLPTLPYTHTLVRSSFDGAGGGGIDLKCRLSFGTAGLRQRCGRDSGTHPPLKTASRKWGIKHHSYSTLLSIHTFEGEGESSQSNCQGMSEAKRIHFIFQIYM